MNDRLDHDLRDDLHDVAFPAELVPPPHLADTVLRTARRRRRTLTAAVGVAAAAVTVAAVLVAPAVFAGGDVSPGAPPTPSLTVPAPGRTDDPGGGPGPALSYATPGGGPQVVHVYTEGERSHLLDLTTGGYVELPFTVVLSPDLKRVAVNDNGRLGIADRAGLIRDPAAVHWLGVPPGNGPSWSPDGKAVLWTSLVKDPTVHFTVHRVDVATDHVTETPVPMQLLGSTVSWAADSRNYLVLLRGAESNDSVEPGGLQYLAPDGIPGARLDVGGGTVTAFSPSRRYVLTDASDLMSAKPLQSPVLDTGTGTVAALVPARVKPVGWYDDSTLIGLTRNAGGTGSLDLMTLATGAVTGRIPLAGVGRLTDLQIGPSTGLTPRASKLGF